jgi:hypothetical protein
LNADGYYLDIQIREGRIIPISPRRKTGGTSEKEKPSKSLYTVNMASEAVEVVKNDLTREDTVTGERKTVERRMLDAKAGASPKLKWKYVGKKIGGYRYRVTQYVEGGAERQTIRTWIVDLETVKVTPENSAAKKLY